MFVVVELKRSSEADYAEARRLLLKGELIGEEGGMTRAKFHLLNRTECAELLALWFITKGWESFRVLDDDGNVMEEERFVSDVLQPYCLSDEGVEDFVLSEETEEEEPEDLDDIGCGVHAAIFVGGIFFPPIWIFHIKAFRRLFRKMFGIKFRVEE